MQKRARAAWQRLSLAQQYMLASLVVLACGMVGVGWWVSVEIQAGVTQQTAATTALYVDSFVTPRIQELAEEEALTPEHIASLDRLVQETPLGQQIVSFKIWDSEGRIVYSANRASIGQVYPMHDELAEAWQGRVTTTISDLEDEEHHLETQFGERLLETYSPVRLKGTNRIIAVAEFYQTVDHLERQLSTARTYSWLVVGVAALVMYVLLAGIVRRGSDTIASQQRDLMDKVSQLSDLLAENEGLNARIRRAATRTTALNERFLRRVSAELHDGPAQTLGLALLRMDTIVARSEESSADNSALPQVIQDLDHIQKSLHDALDEIRALSSGLTLPELEDLTLHDTVARVVRVHERRTDTTVKLDLVVRTNRKSPTPPIANALVWCDFSEGSPDSSRVRYVRFYPLEHIPGHASLSAKITLYRLIQEALTNAYRHANGAGQQVSVTGGADDLRVEIADQGPGFDPAEVTAKPQHLGLNAMRERVESIGGSFRIESDRAAGTRVIARLPFQADSDHD